jgi:putative protease
MNYYNQPELLSPVGNWDSLYAAVQNGCDAIYVGGTSFNARNRADNFSTSELEAVIDYAHIRGVRVYITANILYKEEVKGVLKFIEEVYQAGADAIIIQDMGVAKLVAKFFPDIELHASTQMNIHNLAGVELLEELGFSRVILARELSLTEIKEINRQTDLKVETFVHGALCISYSGQCLMSSLIGGRSGNRGRCAQPCRMPYTLIDRESKAVIDNNFSKQHLLSPKDVNTLEMLPELIEAGIASFKIEGRLKRPEYTAAVTRLYNKYIDQFYQDRDNYEVDPKDQQTLAQIFNRNGFVPGYYQGQADLDLISYQRPKNWGVQVGVVNNYNPQTKTCRIELTDQLNAGDGIEIWTERGENVGLTLSEIEEVGPQEVAIDLKRRVDAGDAVYKTSDQQLLSSLAESYRNPDTLKEIEVYGTLTAKIDQKLKLDLWDQAGYFVTVEVDFVVERAKQQPVTANELEEQLSKLGSTPYLLANLDLDTDNNLFIPISQLNQLRRDAVKKLNQARKEGAQPEERRNKFVVNKLENSTDNSYQVDEPQLTVAITNNELLEDVAKTGVKRVYCPNKNLDLANLKRVLEKYPRVEIFVRLPQIAHQSEMEELKVRLEELETTQIDGYLIPQLGALHLARGTDKSIVADAPLNTFNRHSLELLGDLGCETVTLSPELTLTEIKEVNHLTEPEQEIIIYGHLAMMVSEYCPVGGVESKFDSSQGCQIDCEGTSYGLLDRKGMVEPIETDRDNCRSFIYNSQPLYLLQYLDEIKESGCEQLRLNFTIESKEEVLEMISAYQGKLAEPDKIVSTAIQNYTTGHFYRGVL